MPTAAPTSAPQPETSEGAPTEVEASKYGEYPATEQTFVTTIQDTIATYDAAETDLQRSKVMRDRNKKLVADLGGRKVTDWVGVIRDVGANGEGKAHVAIEVADGVLMKTWNNAFSDLTDETLIPDSSPMFDVLLNAKPGDRVVFSGTIATDRDATIRTSYLTEVFTVRTPEFIVKFSSIKQA